MKKLDTKTFRGKRIYVPIPGAQGIVRLYSWDEERGEYRPPATAKSYLARRWEVDKNGKRNRKAAYFDFMAQASDWQRKLRPDAAEKETLTDVVENFRRRHYPTLSEGTTDRYDDIIRFHLEPFLLGYRVDELTPAVVDDWVEWLLKRKDEFGKGAIRQSFTAELRLLKTLLNFYADYADDKTFLMPVVKRHAKAVRFRTRRVAAKKNVSDKEFDLFARRLEADFGLAMRGLATCQYDHPGRISEPAALHWEDVEFDRGAPRLSVIHFRRHVVYRRRRNAPRDVLPGFKNDADGMKTHPVMPRLHAVLARLWRPGATGLVFAAPEGGVFKYRQIQYAYNATWERLGLPYTSTHVLRHGGTRRTLEETGGDRDIAKQQLGNASVVDTYAVRSEQALGQYVNGKWDESERLVANGRREKAGLTLVKED